MTDEELVRDLKRYRLVLLQPTERPEALASARVVRLDYTCVAGCIRILAIDDVVAVEEETETGERLLRGMPSMEQAVAFVERRLESYAPLWRGLTCPIEGCR